jgi:hypothetical protein
MKTIENDRQQKRRDFFAARYCGNQIAAGQTIGLRRTGLGAIADDRVGTPRLPLRTRENSKKDKVTPFLEPVDSGRQMSRRKKFWSLRNGSA